MVEVKQQVLFCVYGFLVSSLVISMFVSSVMVYEWGQSDRGSLLDEYKNIFEMAKKKFSCHDLIWTTESLPQCLTFRFLIFSEYN